MPIYALRNSKIPADLPLTGTLTDAVVNGMDNAAYWFTMGGKLVAQWQSERYNGRVFPIGISGGVAGVFGVYGQPQRITIPNGYGFYQLQALIRLTTLFSINVGVVHPTVRFKWVNGGESITIATYNAETFPNETYINLSGKLPMIMRKGAMATYDSYFVAEIDMSEGNRNIDGNPATGAGLPVNQYIGINYFNLHLFKDPDITF